MGLVPAQVAVGANEFDLAFDILAAKQTPPCSFDPTADRGQGQPDRLEVAFSTPNALVEHPRREFEHVPPGTFEPKFGCRMDVGA